MTQTILFDNPLLLARMADPESSHIAACKFIKDGKIGKHEATILWVLASTQKALTTHEIAKLAHNLPWDYIPLTNEQVHKRVKGLEDKGRIKRGAIRPCSITGNTMTEWRLNNER